MLLDSCGELGGRTGAANKGNRAAVCPSDTVWRKNYLKKIKYTAEIRTCTNKAQDVE